MSARQRGPLQKSACAGRPCRRSGSIALASAPAARRRRNLRPAQEPQPPKPDACGCCRPVVQHQRRPDQSVDQQRARAAVPGTVMNVTVGSPNSGPPYPPAPRPRPRRAPGRRDDPHGRVAVFQIRVQAVLVAGTPERGLSVGLDRHAVSSRDRAEEPAVCRRGAPPSAARQRRAACGSCRSRSGCSGRLRPACRAAGLSSVRALWAWIPGIVHCPPARSCSVRLHTLHAAALASAHVPALRRARPDDRRPSSPSPAGG